MTVNKAILVGNLGKDPDLRTTTGGSPVCTFSLATTDRRKDKDGNWNDHTEWHTVVVFGRQAETAGQYLHKGRMVYVEGRIQTRKWQDRNGQDRWTTEIIADNVRFLGGGQQQGTPRRDAGRRDVQGGEPGLPEEAPPPPEGDAPYEDMPF
jgi:single-strand DNA-binding protein